MIIQVCPWDQNKILISQKERLCLFDLRMMTELHWGVSYGQEITHMSWSIGQPGLITGGPDPFLLQWTDELELQQKHTVFSSINFLKTLYYQGESLLLTSFVDQKEGIWIWSYVNSLRPTHWIKSIKKTISNVFLELDQKHILIKDSSLGSVPIKKELAKKRTWLQNTVAISNDWENKLTFAVNKSDPKIIVLELKNNFEQNGRYSHFVNLKEELLFYEQVWKNSKKFDFLGSLKNFAMEAGNKNTQFKDMIMFIYKVIKERDYQKVRNRTRSGQQINDTELIQKAISLIQHENNSFFQQLQNEGKILFNSENRLYISNDAKEHLIEYLDQLHRPIFNSGMSFVSQTCTDVIQQYLDQGFVIGFFLYRLLQGKIELDEHLSIKIESDFINLLRTQDLNTIATEVIW